MVELLERQPRLGVPRWPPCRRKWRLHWERNSCSCCCCYRRQTTPFLLPRCSDSFFLGNDLEPSATGSWISRNKVLQVARLKMQTVRTNDPSTICYESITQRPEPRLCSATCGDDVNSSVVGLQLRRFQVARLVSSWLIRKRYWSGFVP